MKIKMTLIFIGFCFFMHYSLKAQDVEAEWAQHVSGPGDIDSRAIALDQDENNYIIANFRGVLNIATITGNITITQEAKRNPSSSTRDLLIAKLDSSGGIIWAKSVGGKGNIEGKSIKVDHDKNIYVSGFYEDTTDFDPGVNKAFLGTIFYQIGGSGDGAIQGYYRNSFLLKLDNNGEFKWVRNFYGNGNEANGVAIENSGENVYIAGTFNDTIDVDQQKGTNLLIAQPNRGDIFVAKFDNEGNYIWAKQMGRSKKGNNIANGISVDDKNFVYTTGRFSDSADFDPGSGTVYLISGYANSPYQTNVFISKLDSNGNYVWAKGVNEKNKGLASLGVSITNDPSGSVLITGRFQGTLDFDPAHTNPNASLTVARISPFVAKYDDEGNYVWARAFETSGGRGTGEGAAITTDDVGNVYTTGSFTNNMIINPGSHSPIILTTTKNQNTFISKLDKEGVYVWGKQFYGGNNRGFGIVVSEERKLYLNGYFQDTINFNPVGQPMISYISAGNGDAYVVKLSCIDPSDTAFVIELCADQYEFNGKEYDKSGIYKQVFWNVSGCDSTVTLELTLNKIIKPVINVEGFVLGVASTYDTYQWILNDVEISGATDSTYTLNENGNYRVAVITDKGCKDTSDVYTVNNVNINDVASSVNKIGIYPNPTSGLIHLIGQMDVNAQITSIEGKTLLYEKNVDKLSLESFASGIYFVRLFDRYGNLLKIEKIVKQ